MRKRIKDGPALAVVIVTGYQGVQRGRSILESTTTRRGKDAQGNGEWRLVDYNRDTALQRRVPVQEVSLAVLATINLVAVKAGKAIGKCSFLCFSQGLRSSFLLGKCFALN
jgi:hypothetical protein